MLHKNLLFPEKAGILVCLFNVKRRCLIKTLMWSSGLQISEHNRALNKCSLIFVSVNMLKGSSQDVRPSLGPEQRPWII